MSNLSRSHLVANGGSIASLWTRDVRDDGGRTVRVALVEGSVREYHRGEKVDIPLSLMPMPETRKNTAGYRLTSDMDWIDLFCGSEGTLGIVLEATIVLLPIPRELFAGIIFFPSDDQALDAVDAWRACDDLRMLEYADRNALNLLAGALSGDTA